MNERRRYPLCIALAFSLALAGLSVAGSSAATAQTPIAGMVRQTEVRLSAMVSGRLLSVNVVPGQKVTRGTLLAVLDNPELAASVEEARAALASVRAERDRVYAGVRPEEIAIAEQSVQNAEANLRLAGQMNERAVALAARSVATRARVDESTATLARAEADLEVKTAQLEAARAGATVEERSLVDAKLGLAAATLADLTARLEKTKLVAVIDGIIGTQIAELGEILPAGKPILKMKSETDRWFGFTLREDQMQGIAIETTLSVSRANGPPIKARVTELRPLGEFATWRAARAVGDHDLNSFRLRLDPIGSSDGLEAGMTVFLQPEP